jgi:hypothetical protein
MGAIVKCIELAGKVIQIEGEEKSPAGMWLQAYDVEAHEGRGAVQWTESRYNAMIFHDPATAMRLWQTQSVTTPLRPDGKPNRPLTAYTVEVENLSDQDMFDLLFDGYTQMKQDAVTAGIFDVPFMVNFGTDQWVLTAMMADRNAMEMACAQMVVEYGPPNWVSTNTDAYVKSFPEETDPTQFRKGDLENAFHDGDLEIREQIMSIGVSADHTVYARSREYVIGDDGMIEFTEAKMGHELVGTVTNTLHRLIELNDPDVFHDFILRFYESLKDDATEN